MKNRIHDWHDHFPRREEIEDHAGKARGFGAWCHEGVLGYTLRAREEGQRSAGYEFAAYSETCSHHVLGHSRQKMRREWSVLHSSGQPGNYRTPKDELSGQFTFDREIGVLLFIDGIARRIDERSSLPATCETRECETPTVDAID